MHPHADRLIPADVHDDVLAVTSEPSPLEVFVDGEWAPVSPMRAVTFEPDEEREPAPWELTPEEQEWHATALFTEALGPGVLRHLILENERRIIAERWASRVWLARPYNTINPRQVVTSMTGTI